MKTDERLDAFWISKLGAERVAELPGGTSGRSTLAKALNVARELKGNRSRFYELLYQGFDGYFHQSVYLRALGQNSMARSLEELPIGKVKGAVEWWSPQPLGQYRIRVLAGIRKEMQFLTAAEQVLRQTVAVPALVEAFPSHLRVRVLTVQSTVPTWSELLGVAISRILTPMRMDTELADLLFHAVAPNRASLGEMRDLSSEAVALMKKTDSVYTYSGTFGVRKVGRTRHSTEGGQLGKRRPLHLVMPDEFDELIKSNQIRHCEIEIKKDYKSLTPGTALVLYPVEGKLVFRRMLGGGVIDDFLAYLAG